MRWPCNEQHPRGTERLYADANHEFPTMVEKTESYLKDPMTGHAHTKREYEAIEKARPARLGSSRRRITRPPK